MEAELCLAHDMGGGWRHWGPPFGRHATAVSFCLVYFDINFHWMCHEYFLFF